MKVAVALALTLPTLCLADFDKAVVKFNHGSEEAVVMKKDLPKLMALFPGLKERKRGSKPAGWGAGTEVRFLGKGQAPLIVRIDTYNSIWTWGNGNGDFRPAEGLASYLAELRRKAKPVKKTG